MTPPATPTSLYDRLLARQTAAPTRPVPARASAAVVPWRRGPAGEIEVYWVRRSPRLRFMGGWWAFPGGGLDPGDARLRVPTPAQGASAATRSLWPSDLEGDPFPASEGPPADGDVSAGLEACAIRELFEETGLLLTEAGSGEADASARSGLLAGETTFGDLVASRGWRLSAGDLVFAGRWLTPPFAPIRYDNRFFLLHWPRRRPVQPTIVPGELVDGTWIGPSEALARWEAGEVLVAPPILHLLRVLADAGPEDGVGRLRHSAEADLGPVRRIEFLPGITVIPLATPTLPPATHTNCFLLGRRQAVVVDPAPAPGPELDRLLSALEAAQRDHGMELRGIWLSHHHRDHVRGTNAVRETFGIEVAAHRLSRPGLEAEGIAVDRWLEHGERIVLAGDPPFEIEVLHTPGHTRGHLAFLCPGQNAALVGDLISALSTIVIDPPEGEMSAYLASLEALRARAPAVLLPSHGPLLTAGVERLAWFHRHRLEREEQILAAWREGARDADAIVDRVYGALDARLRPVAARQVEAHLVRLRTLRRLLA